MFERLTQRVWPALQLTRMTMVFTAVADGLCAVLLQAQRTRLAHNPQLPLSHFVDARLLAAMALISVGLYGYGVGLNDLIDRRRDRQLAADRPLPAGRISVWYAHLVCFALGAMALMAGAFFAFASAGGWRTFILVAVVGSLISIYDFAARYLVGPGLLLLGLIRFLHAMIPVFDWTVPWQPLLLFNHVTILAALGYLWDEKRPSLTPLHIWIVVGGLVTFDAAYLALAWNRHALEVQWGLLVPAFCAMAFIPIAYWVYRRRTHDGKSTGRVIRLGLLWLIVYDAAFVGGLVSWKGAALLLLLLPLTLLSQHLVQWWSNILSLWRRPQFKRMRLG